MPVHARTCHLCEAMCGLLVTVENGRIEEIRGDDADVFSRGHVCPKGPALRELHEDPDRLRHPMRRTAGGWQEVSWDAALSEAGERLFALQREHGRDSVGLYFGNPAVHGHGIALAAQGFMRALHTRNRFDANSQDANPKLFACMAMYGDQLSLTVPDVDRTDFLLILGANPAASNGSLMSLGDVRGRLTAVRERGGRVVLIDPRRTETAAWCDEHHFIRPGGDAALLLAMHHVLFDERLACEGPLVDGTRGLADLQAIAAAFPPERVAGAVGIDAATIRALTRAFARAPRAVAYGRCGTCQNEFGATASWLIEALNVVTGNFDRAGGAMFPSPAVDLARIARKLVGNSFARWRSRVRGLPEFSGALPAAAIAEEIETPGDGQIRGFVCVAGNPVLSVPNGPRLDRALGRLEFMVAIDPYINETARHAHLVLPPTSALERSHFDLVLHGLQVRNTVRYSPPVLEPPDGALSDWDILYELGMRLGGMRLGLPVVDRAARLLWRAGLRPSADRVLDLLLRMGPLGDHFRPGHAGLSLARLREAPHGIDLGALAPSRAARVRTDDGKVDLAPDVLRGDVARVERWLGSRAAILDGPLLLIGRRHLRSNNSWMHNCHSLVKGPDRAGLRVHPDDARRLHLSDGQRVRVRSRTGAVEAQVEPSDEVMPGVVSLPHGYGHELAAATLRIAGAVPGPNVNALTDDARLDAVTGTAALNGVPVTIEPLGSPTA